MRADRNFVKALPWFGSVREKLEDKQFWGYFLHYKNASGDTATTNLYAPCKVDWSARV